MDMAGQDTAPPSLGPPPKKEGPRGPVAMLAGDRLVGACGCGEEGWIQPRVAQEGAGHVLP